MEKNQKKKVISLIIIVITAMAVAIAWLSVALYHTNEALNAAEADIEGMSFVEGKVVENKTGGVVTASLKGWSYFKDDTFITASKPVPTGTIEGIFCSLHNAGLMEACKGDLVKLKFSKQVTVKSGTSSEKTYYLVGNYYISDAKVG